jgi:hypothetical protein
MKTDFFRYKDNVYLRYLSLGLLCLIFFLNVEGKAQITNETDHLALLDVRNNQFATNDYRHQESRLVSFSDNSSKQLAKLPLIANRTITVDGTIDAVDDDFLSTTIPATGGTTATVFTNDAAVGVSPATGALLQTPTIVTDGGMTGVSINSAGVITVPANTLTGDYTVRYQICLAADSTVCDEANVQIRIVCPNIPPPVGSVTGQPTCSTPTGTIVFTSPTSDVEYSIDGTDYQNSPTFSSVAPGTYTLSIRSTNDSTCIASGDTVTVNAVPNAPTTPVGSVTEQPTCSTPTGTIVFTSPTSDVQYSIDGTDYQNSPTFGSVTSGAYRLRVRSTNDSTCIASGDTVTVNAVPNAPATPVGSVTDQPTCSVPTGTVVFTSPTSDV